MLDRLPARFQDLVPAVDRWSLRCVQDHGERLCVRQDVPEPVTHSQGCGAMITIADRGGVGYAATSDLSSSGLRRAIRRACDWAHQSSRLGLARLGPPPASGVGSYHTPVGRDWADVPLGEKMDALREAGSRLRASPLVVDWQASVGYRHTETLLLTSEGARIHQSIAYVDPGLLALASDGQSSQTRTRAFRDTARQGGWEQLQGCGFFDSPEAVGEEALALLAAPQCPSGQMELLVMPSQMMIQIHESIGHPLELDRILGDERNYAGTSFVTLDMFGHYRYGSELLDVVFDPTDPRQLASYRFDDEGHEARTEYLIRAGVLLRPLGSALSQQRAGIPGVANARASDWNRPPIDRMANINVLPGADSMQRLVGSIEHGVLMDTNRSWSIDDSRNKFQFGCELGRVIRDGELGPVVKNPSYRGVSSTFWRSLVRVGDASTLASFATTSCGKGEPNQLITVGHSAPACVFRDVAVFGFA